MRRRPYAVVVFDEIEKAHPVSLDSRVNTTRIEADLLRMLPIYFCKSWMRVF